MGGRSRDQPGDRLSRSSGLTAEAGWTNVCSMPRDTTRRIPAAEARRQARIDQGKDPDDLSDIYRGRPTRPKKLEPIDTTSTRYVPSRRGRAPGSRHRRPLCAVARDDAVLQVYAANLALGRLDHPR